MHNKRLAIAIPTYNRCEILREDLLLILPEIIEHSIAVYISDDSSNDDTRVPLAKRLSSRKVSIRDPDFWSLTT